MLRIDSFGLELPAISPPIPMRKLNFDITVRASFSFDQQKENLYFHSS